MPSLGVDGEQGCTPGEGVIRELGLHSVCGWGRPLGQPSMPALPADFGPFSIELMPHREPLAAETFVNWWAG